jgi:hypothetical protein
MSITHWRLYLSSPIGEGVPYVELSETAADQLRRAMHGDSRTYPVVTGRELNPRDYRTLYVQLSQVVALEPRED